MEGRVGGAGSVAGVCVAKLITACCAVLVCSDPPYGDPRRGVQDRGKLEA